MGGDGVPEEGHLPRARLTEPVVAEPDAEFGARPRTGFCFVRGEAVRGAVQRAVVVDTYALCAFFDCEPVLRGIIVIRTFDRHKNLHIPVFLRTVFGPDYCVPL